MSINSQPGLLPVDFVPDDVQGGRQSLETYQARAQLICDHTAFQQRVARLLADRYEDKTESTNVEERIYSGFPSNDDQTLMHSFHEGNWEDRLGVIQEIKDDRYRQLGQRIVATERPDLLTNIQRQRWDFWCKERLYPEGETPWLTAPRALAELSDLTKNVSPDQKRQLADVQHFLEALEN